MYPYYCLSPWQNRRRSVSDATGVIIVALTVGVIAIAAYNASTNHKSYEIMQKQYDARSAS